MKNWILLLTAVCLSWAAAAQKHFIYIQSENNAPFYGKMGDKILSSTFSGYVIIPNLADSTYSISLGFAGNNAETRFAIELKGRDRGYLIKNMDGAMNLFDLQTLTLLKPLTDKTSSKYSFQRRNNAFTNLLAKATNDTSLLYVRVEVVEPKKEEIKEAVAIITPDSKTNNEEKVNTQPAKDSAMLSNPVVTNQVVKTEPSSLDSISSQTTTTFVPNTDTIISLPATDTTISVSSNDISKVRPDVADSEIEYKRSLVTRRSESSTTEGFGLTFWDEQNGSIDTIRILIPNPKVVYKNTVVEVANKDAKKFLDITDSISIQPAKQDTIAVAERIKCQSQASNRDFLDLRKTMAAQEGDKEMIEVAGKSFNEKCFTTEQVKNLSTLFLSDETKFLFFEVAINSVSDKDKFALLQSELKEETYINRFKALIAQ